MGYGRIFNVVKRHLYVPPVRTKTRFHNGVLLHHGSINRSLAYEYFGAPSDPEEYEKFSMTRPRPTTTDNANLAVHWRGTLFDKRYMQRTVVASPQFRML